MKRIKTIIKTGLTAAIISVAVLCAPLVSHGEADDKIYGAVEGEKLVFNVHWLGIPAARAVMKMNSAASGKYQLEAKVQTIGMANFIHDVNDLLKSDGNLSSTRDFQSSTYHKDQRTGNKIFLSDYLFKLEESAIYRSWKNQKPKKIDITSKNTNDPLSAFYTLRSRPQLLPDTTLTWHTIDSNKEIKLIVKVGHKRVEHTPLGMFEIIPLKVKTPASVELFRQEDAIEIWLTADERRMPVRVETRMKLGSVAADLVEFDDGRGEQGNLMENEEN